MSEDVDRRLADVDWKARMEVYQQTQVKALTRIEEKVDKTNERVASLELSRARNAWLIRAAGVVGLAGAVRAFSHTTPDIIPK